MKYLVEGITIKSHNSAKPQKTASIHLLEYLEQYIDIDDIVLDFGCGKLRYSIPISKKANKVIAVDSSEQILRQIKINGQSTTVLQDSIKYKNIEVIDVNDNKWVRSDYNVILLIHVLSAIPDEEDRKKIVDKLFDIMDKECKIICCNNHRMSYFKKWENSDKVIKYNDGYLVKEPTPSYFGKIDKIKLKEYFPVEKFNIEEVKIQEDNTIFVCKKRIYK